VWDIGAEAVAVRQRRAAQIFARRAMNFISSVMTP